ncbi:hypothetical protein [Phenylobacterium sp.]|uniref:hypothetical protein n=1 Tax=Phenylobacterium sp. TaxID=1871053 RepID=UPI00289BE5A0|nr:hypothetical protein [Phenylobacterium sp.]
MRAVVPVIAAALALAGCASLGKETAPVCDGKHRRPANLYGSVLDPAAPPTAAADKLSALPATYGSCA